MKHPYDPKTQLSYIVWHEDDRIEESIRHIIELGKPDRFVETGSHMGWTCHWVAENYPNLPIYTVEVDVEFYNKARENLEPFSQVSVKHGTSPEFLQSLLPVLKNGLNLFWLDAHWYPPVPLKRECEVVSTLDKYICLIDDFSCWEPDFLGDTFFSIYPSSGDAYLNDLSYVTKEMGEVYWRPKWEQPKGGKGVGMFLKGVDYEPPIDFWEKETLDEFLEKRRRSIQRRKDEPGFVSYPVHPSCGRTRW